MMTLFAAHTSPYARKVRMAVIEAGLSDRVETVRIDPYADAAALQDAAPLGKVPALLTEDGRALYDSPVICAYLDALAPAAGLIPDGDRRWEALTREALADGILDAAFATVMERRRPEAQRSEYWLERWRRAILRALDAVEADGAGLEGAGLIAEIATGAALGYLDFRLPELVWREARPQTAAWFARFAERSSMRETAPPAA